MCLSQFRNFIRGFLSFVEFSDGRSWKSLFNLFLTFVVLCFLSDLIEYFVSSRCCWVFMLSYKYYKYPTPFILFIWHTIKPANIWPWGIFSDVVLDSDGVRAGVHSSTNIYIDPSNKDWIIPKHNIFGSEIKISL